MLANERVRLHGEVSIHFWHVQIINEVDQTFVALRTEGVAGLLLQRLLENPLKHTTGGIEIERHVHDLVVFTQGLKFIAHYNRFSRSCTTDQHDGSTSLH